jgi:putative membrane protein
MRDRAASLARTLGLTRADLDSIGRAIAKAEGASSGEISVAIAKESSDYSFWELLASLVVGMVTFATLISFYVPIASALDSLMWHMSEWVPAAVIGGAGFLSIAVFFLMANLPFVDRLIVPKRARKRACYRRALRHFVESGLYATEERTGILIFISCMERAVRILADTGINAAIDVSAWNSMAESIAASVRKKRLGEALVDSIEACEKLLSGRFPPREGNKNELPDAIAFLGADS